MTHSNMDIRIHTSLDPLGATVIPHVPVSGKGSRAKHYCACGEFIAPCGQKAFREGRFNIWYSIHGAASCVWCWGEIYADQGGEE